MLELLLFLAVIVPLVAGLVELARPGIDADRNRRPGLAAAVGAGVALASVAVVGIAGAVTGAPIALGADAPWLRADPVVVLVGGVASLIGLTVVVYARRALDPGEDALRTAVLGPVVLTGTITVAAAGRLSILVLGWVAASTAVVLLQWHHRDPARRAAARRAATALAIGDGALVAATAVVFLAAGDPALDGLAGVVPALGAGQLAAVATLLVVAALARGAQLPLPGWLPGTLAAPTSTSALLHAGVVNAGAVLLIRTFDLVAAAPLAVWALALACIATILVAAGAGLARPDAKGSLALSTSAQMGFMLVSVAVGAPGAALTHLAGHACYKSARSLGVGATVAASARRRRFRMVVVPASVAHRVALGAVALAAGAVPAALAALALPTADAWMVGAAIGATTAIATASWLVRPQASIGLAVGGVAGILAGAVAALATAVALESVLVDELPTAATAVAAPVALALLGIGGLAGHAALRNRTLAPRLWSHLGAVGRLPTSLSTPHALRSQP